MGKARNIIECLDMHKAPPGFKGMSAKDLITLTEACADQAPRTADNERATLLTAVLTGIQAGSVYGYKQRANQEQYNRRKTAKDQRERIRAKIEKAGAEKIPEAVTVRFMDLKAEQAATLQEILEDAKKHGIRWDIVNKERRKTN